MPAIIDAWWHYIRAAIHWNRPLLPFETPSPSWLQDEDQRLHSKWGKSQRWNAINCWSLSIPVSFRVAQVVNWFGIFFFLRFAAIRESSEKLCNGNRIYFHFLKIVLWLISVDSFVDRRFGEMLMWGANDRIIDWKWTENEHESCWLINWLPETHSFVIRVSSSTIN